MSRLESDYYTHMGFDREHKRRVLGFYVPFFERSGPVLELGPGHGEFLGLLREAGIEAIGVDSDEGMVEAARGEGHKVELGDAVEYLHTGARAGSFAGVFCAHFVEHLPTGGVERLLAGVRRVLVPGGRFVAATPNPACYAVLSGDFWRDPTHVRFYDLPLLEFLCRKAGLGVERSGPNPCNHPGAPPETRAAQEIVVHPGLDEWIETMGARVGEALAHVPPDRGPHAHDPTWAYELIHIVKTLSGRLTETQEALRSLQDSHQRLLGIMYQANEVFVAARLPDGDR
jgi:SAM-dependent methyltransferase